MRGVSAMKVGNVLVVGIVNVVRGVSVPVAGSANAMRVRGVPAVLSMMMGDGLRN